MFLRKACFFFEMSALSNSDLRSFQIFSASPGLTENYAYRIRCSISSLTANLPPTKMGGKTPSFSLDENKGEI